jgi:hypothetical protein
MVAGLLWHSRGGTTTLVVGFQNNEKFSVQDQQSQTQTGNIVVGAQMRSS